MAATCKQEVVTVCKRVFDIIFSTLVLFLMSPLFIIIAIIIKCSSRGSVLYRSQRIGKNGQPFTMYKFRSMVENADKLGRPNVSDNDSRVTRVGRFLRNTKLDEFPQMLNILKGDMSFIGPRPEVVELWDLYSPEERQPYELRPGLSDWASIAHYNQHILFTKAIDADELYREVLRPLKSKLQLLYMNNHSIFIDAKIIVWTLLKVVFKTKALPKEIDSMVNNYACSMEVHEKMDRILGETA